MAAEPGAPTTGTTISVVIVENHALFRKGLRAQLETDPAIEVVAEFDTAAEAVREVPELRPAVVLMDYHLPWTRGTRPTYCGAQAITQIRQRWPDANIAVISMFDDNERVHEALKAGARSYVSKDGRPEEVINVVHLTAQGSGVLNRNASEAVKKILPTSSNGSTSFPELTDRQNEQLALAAAGDTDKQIAAKLNLVPKTVANYWSNIRTQLGVSSRAEAIKLAQANGFQPDRDASCDSEQPG